MKLLQTRFLFIAAMLGLASKSHAMTAYKLTYTSAQFSRFYSAPGYENPYDTSTFYKTSFLLKGDQISTSYIFWSTCVGCILGATNNVEVLRWDAYINDQRVAGSEFGGFAMVEANVTFDGRVSRGTVHIAKPGNTPEVTFGSAYTWSWFEYGQTHYDRIWWSGFTEKYPGSLSPVIETGTAEQGIWQLNRVTISDSPPSPVPEPSAWTLVLSGFAAVGGAARYVRRRTLAVSAA